MFSAPKLAKTKPLTTPANNMNTNKKYISDLANSRADLCNRSFDTAQTLYRGAASGSGQQSSNNLRQTRLGIRQRTDNEENEQPALSSKSIKKSTEFFLMPLPQNEKKSYKAQKETSLPLQTASDAENVDPMTKYGRNNVFLLGKVDFCLKMHKLYATTNALWSVFGKLIKIIEGKNRFERYLLLRNNSGDGPVMKCIFYDLGEDLCQIQTGDALRVVGRFQNENFFRAHKIEKWNSENSTEDFPRIQNVISFVLLQKHSQETNNCV